MTYPFGFGTIADMAKPDHERVRRALAAFFDRMKTERKLSRRKVCKLAGVSEATVRGFLAGDNTSMRLDTLEKLASAAGISMEEMLGNGALVQSRADIASVGRLHRLLVAILTIAEREKIKLTPRQVADLFVAIYGIAPKEPIPDPIPPEIERLILLYLKRG